MPFVSRLAENPNSIFCVGPKAGNTKGRDGSACHAGTPAERHNCATEGICPTRVECTLSTRAPGFPSFPLTQTYHGWTNSPLSGQVTLGSTVAFRPMHSLNAIWSPQRIGSDKRASLD